MGSNVPVPQREFEWSYTEEPHAERRMEILRLHPEVKRLFGIDRSFPFVVAAIVVTQCLLCFYLKDKDWTLILLEVYFVGGLMNHALTLAIHELAHNLGFGLHRPLFNRFFSMFANLPIAVPAAISFKKYHLEHHRYMGEEGLDTDIPTDLEVRLFTTTPRKILWLILQPFFYAFRPLIIYRKAPTDLEVINAIIQLSFDYFIYCTCGVKGIAYLVLCTFISMGFHPTAGHFISEHYVMKSGQETYSYYGPLNFVTFNVGYHVEHHDFPFISGRSLPLVRPLAPEFYDSLLSHNSWIYVLWVFLTNPCVGPFSRIKRLTGKQQQFYGTNVFWPYVEGWLCYCGITQLWHKMWFLQIHDSKAT